jgi:hypothetical protein
MEKVGRVSSLPPTEFLPKTSQSSADCRNGTEYGRIYLETLQARDDPEDKRKTISHSVDGGGAVSALPYAQTWRAALIKATREET